MESSRTGPGMGYVVARLLDIEKTAAQTDGPEEIHLCRCAGRECVEFHETQLIACGCAPKVMLQGRLSEAVSSICTSQHGLSHDTSVHRVAGGCGPAVRGAPWEPRPTEGRETSPPPIPPRAPVVRAGGTYASHCAAGTPLSSFSKPAQNFIVRQSSKKGTLALSVRLPVDVGPYIEHYLIEATADAKHCLEGSENHFASIPVLVCHYCQCCDELPVQLCLPTVLLKASTRQELSAFSLLGQ
ncbi:hypothetical protein V5799_015240, partial [Amblyomma americanum]